MEVPITQDSRSRWKVRRLFRRGDSGKFDEESDADAIGKGRSSSTPRRRSHSSSRKQHRRRRVDASSASSIGHRTEPTVLSGSSHVLDTSFDSSPTWQPQKWVDDSKRSPRGGDPALTTDELLQQTPPTIVDQVSFAQLEVGIADIDHIQQPVDLDGWTPAARVVFCTSTVPVGSMAGTTDGQSDEEVGTEVVLGDHHHNAKTAFGKFDSSPKDYVFSFDAFETSSRQSAAEAFSPVKALSDANYFDNQSPIALTRTPPQQQQQQSKSAVLGHMSAYTPNSDTLTWVSHEQDSRFADNRPLKEISFPTPDEGQQSQKSPASNKVTNETLAFRPSSLETPILEDFDAVTNTDNVRDEIFEAFTVEEEEVQSNIYSAAHEEFDKIVEEDGKLGESEDIKGRSFPWPDVAPVRARTTERVKRLLSTLNVSAKHREGFELDGEEADSTTPPHRVVPDAREDGHRNVHARHQRARSFPMRTDFMGMIRTVSSGDTPLRPKKEPRRSHNHIFFENVSRRFTRHMSSAKLPTCGSPAHVVVEDDEDDVLDQGVEMEEDDSLLQSTIHSDEPLWNKNASSNRKPRFWAEQGPPPTAAPHGLNSKSSSYEDFSRTSSYSSQSLDYTEDDTCYSWRRPRGRFQDRRRSRSQRPELLTDLKKGLQETVEELAREGQVAVSKLLSSTTTTSSR